MIWGEDESDDREIDVVAVVVVVDDDEDYCVRIATACSLIPC
jgi:hypothetical protein